MKHPHYRPHDERHNPTTGEWTCPGCMRRRQSNWRSKVNAHLCCRCSGSTWVLERRNHQARDGATGLMWGPAVTWRSLSSWWLYRNNAVVVGTVDRLSDGRWQANDWKNPRVVCIHVGTLADCAHAIVNVNLERTKRAAHEIGATYEANLGNRSMSDDHADMADHAGYEKWSDVPKDLREVLTKEWERGRREERDLRKEGW